MAKDELGSISDPVIQMLVFILFWPMSKVKKTPPARIIKNRNNIGIVSR